MKTTYLRDIVLLSVVPSAFLFLAVIHPVGAQDEPASSAVEIQLASVATQHGDARSVSPRPTASTARAKPTVESGASTERRCERIDRIGKFRITRCD
jgi:hypothetical protein